MILLFFAAGALPAISATNHVEVTVDLTRQLFIGGVSTLNRDQIFNWHDAAGLYDYTADEAASMLDTNKVYVGRSVGGLSWIRKQVPDEDQLRPGYVDVTALTDWCRSRQDSETNDWAWVKGRYQTFVVTDHGSVFPGQSIAGQFNPTNNTAAAEWASVVWSNRWSDAVRPVFYEPINEPFVNMSGIGTDEQGIVDFHEAMIDRLHADIPDLQVGGPCSAWPVFSLNSYALFRDRVGRYIDQLGHKIDFISWHIYSTLFDDGDLESHSNGANADWQLDLVENYAFNQTDRNVPIVISEFGGGFKNHQTSALWDHWSGLRDWHVLKSVMGKTMTFHERPDRIIKAIPFISGKATWYAGHETNAYPWVAFRQVDGEWQETHLTKFYRFWKDVEGDRFAMSSSDPDIQVHLFVTNKTASLCLNNLDHADAAEVNISALLEDSFSVQSATITRLYFDGADPVLEEGVSLSSWTNITLRPEEAAIIQLEISESLPRERSVYRGSHYGDRTMVPYSGTPLAFTVDADLKRGPICGAVLKVGVTREFGIDIVPDVLFNSVSLEKATDWPGGSQEGVPGGDGGRDQFDGTIRMNVPAELVQAENMIDVSFETAGGFVSTVILDVDSELPFALPITGTVQPEGFVMSWESSPAFNYAVSTSTNLVDNWETLDSRPGTGSVMSFTNNVNAVGFFKVEAGLNR